MKTNSYLLIALLLAASISLIIFIPRWQEENYRNTINAEDIAKLEPKDRVQLQKDLALVENSFRTTLAQIIGGSLLLLSLYLTYRNVKIAQENTRIANENSRISTENLRLVEEGKLTDRFSKAVELLGDEKLEIRLGGVYALERIALDSQKDHLTVIEVLSAFVRERSSQGEVIDEERKRPQEDIQAIMVVIGRRKWIETEKQKINLSYTRLVNCILAGSDFRNTTFHNACFNNSNLIGVNLENTFLWKADFGNTILNSANLKGSNLSHVNFDQAMLNGTDLTNTNSLHLDQLIKAATCEGVKLSSPLKEQFEEWRKNISVVKKTNEKK